MSDKLPFFAAETGTFKTTAPNPHVDLSGTSVSLGTYPVHTFASAAADITLDFASGNTCTVTIWVDTSNWARYEGAVWTDAATDTLDLSAATLMGTAGTISADAAVSVVASLPAQPPASQAEMESGTEVALRSVSPLRVAQAISALAVTRIIFSAYVNEPILWNSYNGITVKAGSCTINGAYLSWSDLTLSSMTIGTTGMWYVYLYNNAGTVELSYSQQSPAWDATLHYFKDGTSGANYRLVHSFRVFNDTDDGRNEILQFTTSYNGSVLENWYHFVDATGSNLTGSGALILSASTTTSITSTQLSLVSIVPNTALAVNTMWALAGATANNRMIATTSPEFSSGVGAFNQPVQVGLAVPTTGAVYIQSPWMALQDRLPRSSTPYLYYSARRASGTGASGDSFTLYMKAWRMKL